LPLNAVLGRLLMREAKSRLRCSVGVFLALASVGEASAAEVRCGTAPVKFNGRPLDLAPPMGFVEICAKDRALCAVLTAGYPPTVTTLGYFVRADEWEARKKAGSGFHNYLIAQADESKPAMLAELKGYVKSRDGAMPDHTDLPGTLLSRGRVNLGIVDESNDSITTGVLLRTQPATLLMREIRQVALNSVVVVGPTILSLYLFRDFETQKDVSMTKQRAKDWLQCLRASN
jgi:hypothetical protein